MHCSVVQNSAIQYSTEMNVFTEKKGASSIVTEKNAQKGEGQSVHHLGIVCP